jgi:hypothetical protein
LNNKKARPLTDFNDGETKIPSNDEINRNYSMGRSVQLCHACRFESEKLLNPANQVDPFCIVKAVISKNVAFLGAILKK